MKKIAVLLSIASLALLASCGNNNVETPVDSDSGVQEVADSGIVETTVDEGNEDA